ncbi:hypothetical protein WMZ97_15900 [Lentibacillus sp. N15]
MKETNRHFCAIEIHEAAIRDNWYPGNNRVMEQDQHLQLLQSDNMKLKLYHFTIEKAIFDISRCRAKSSFTVASYFVL